MDVEPGIVHRDLSGNSQVQRPHPGVIVYPDPCPLEEADIGERVEGIAGIVKDGNPPVLEQGPLQFNASLQQLFSPHDLPGGIARAE